MGGPPKRDDRSAEFGQHRRRPRKNLLPGWGWALLATVATAFAVLGRNTPAVAVSSATLAVVAAVLTVATSLGPWRPTAAAPRQDLPEPLDSVREAFRLDAVGREDLVFLLDRLERAGARPTLPLRRPGEVRAIVDVPEPEFLRFLAARVEELEGSL